MSVTRPPSYTYLVGGYLVYAGLVAIGLVLFLLGRLARAQKIPLEGITGGRRRAGLAAVEADQRPDDQRMVRGRAGGDPHRGRRARRPADRSDAPARTIMRIRADVFSSCAKRAANSGRSARRRRVVRRLRQAHRRGRELPLLHRRAATASPSKRAYLARGRRGGRDSRDLKIVNLEQRPRKLTLASLREWVLNETGVELRDAAYNAIHIGTWYVEVAQRDLRAEPAAQGRRAPRVGSSPVAGDRLPRHRRRAGHEDDRHRL